MYAYADLDVVIETRKYYIRMAYTVLHVMINIV